MPSVMYCKSMIFMARQIAKWQEKEPEHPELLKMIRAMRNIAEYVEDLEVDNRRMHRTIVETKEWTEKS